jgi:hypothetical protein
MSKTVLKSEMVKVTRGWRKLRNEELTKYFYDDQIKENEVGGACSLQEGGE